MFIILEKCSKFENLFAIFQVMFSYAAAISSLDLALLICHDNSPFAVASKMRAPTVGMQSES